MSKKNGNKTAFEEFVSAGICVKKNFPLKKKASFKIGGKADLFIEIKDRKELEAAVKILRKNKMQYMAAGNMTNLLIKDSRIKIGFLKLVGGFNKIELRAKKLVYTGAGADNSKLLNFLVRNGLGGLEFLAGIPGTVGGAVYMNAGAYGRGIGTYVSRVYFTDRKGRSGSVTAKDAGFSYRKSIFQENHSIITGVELAAENKDRKESAGEMREIIKSRHNKHPWDAACAGSFFKNTPDITAGKLIELAGLKGLTVGGAMVSEKHANFLINTGGASYKDVIRLAEKVKRSVYKKFKIKLEEEVIIIR
jgi:UDP-N-acetylmuramate dehydrogenase